jgi:putative hydrolase of the HAD superfamily
VTVSFSPDEIDAFVFDVGGVFLVPDHDRIGPHLREAGFEAPHEPHHYHRAHYRAISAMTADGRDDEGSWDFWHGYRHAYVGELGLEDAEVPDAALAFGELFGGPVALWTQEIPENIAALRRLAATGRPMAIVSNNDGTVEDQLIEFGVCQVGEGPLPSVVTVVDSGIIGIRKPDPAIFRPALEALQTEPIRTLYVGDTVHADVQGARAAGLSVVQLDPYGHHDSFDHDRLPDLVALADLFGA